MYVKRKTEERPSNHICSGKSKIITDSECVFVVPGIWQAMCMRLIEIFILR